LIFEEMSKQKEISDVRTMNMSIDSRSSYGFTPETSLVA